MQAVRQGYTPGNWRVFHGRVAYHVRQIIGGVVILALGFIGVMYLLLNPHIAVVPGAGSGSTPLDEGPFTVARTVDFVVLAVFLLLGLGVSALSASRLTTARDQALVLMPEGFVLSVKNPVAYAYANMQAIAARNNNGTITFSITPIGGGRNQVFRLDGRFGKPKPIATAILAARAEWQRANGSPQQPPLPGTGR